MENFRYNRIGTIDCDIDHPVYGKIPTTLTPEKSKEIIDSGAHIAAYVEQEIPALHKISALEAQQTPRMLRGAALGDTDSIAKLQAIESEIAELRKQL